MKPLVIYHKGCMDGAGAALAAWLKFGEDAEYRPAAYGDPAPTHEELEGRDTYVLDFSWPRETLLRMASSSLELGRTRLVVLDHHKTAQKDCEGLPFCTFDMNKSGAVLAWEHFHTRDGRALAPYQDPELFQYIQDRDLWQWKLPHSKEISAALFARGATEDFRVLKKIHENWNAYGGDSHSLQGTWDMSSKTPLITEGAAILRTEAQMVARAVSTAETVILDGRRCLAVSCPLLQSEIGEALARESARRGDSPIGVVWHRNGQHGGAYRVSLRSADFYYGDGELKTAAPDVSAIAKKLDPKGGGHHRAAGFECQRLPWDKTVAEVREYIRGEWCTPEHMTEVEALEKKHSDDLLLARIGATMEEIG